MIQIFEYDIVKNFKPWFPPRRTGRTTEIYTKAMHDLQSMGGCYLIDHVKGETDLNGSNDVKQRFLHRFLEGYAKFLSVSGGEFVKKNYKIERISSGWELTLKPDTPEYENLLFRLSQKDSNINSILNKL